MDDFTSYSQVHPGLATNFFSSLSQYRPEVQIELFRTEFNFSVLLPPVFLSTLLSLCVKSF